MDQFKGKVVLIVNTATKPEKIEASIKKLL